MEKPGWEKVEGVWRRMGQVEVDGYQWVMA
jgi:hypothetical protein